MNVKVLRMNTGEEVIFTLIEEDDTSLQVQNPLVSVPREYIVYVIDARDEIVENYEKIFSPIQTTGKKLIL